VRLSHSNEPGTAPLIVFAIALAVGLGIAYVDTRATWDDAGVTAGALLLSAGLLAATRPRRWWLTGLLVGLPVPIVNYILYGNTQAIVAVAFALVGAAVGAGIGRSVRAAA
jgi:hypothetical protein